MESGQTLSEEDLTCPVCFNVFKDPVILSCSHSFCKVCIGNCWEQKEIRECPVCKRRSSKTETTSNLALRNLCEAFKKDRSRRATEPLELCSLHGEKLKLFCLVDEEPICVDCLTETHNNHKFCSTTDAVKVPKDDLKTARNNLEDKLKPFCKFEAIFDKTMEHIKCQCQQTEIQINKQFEELHMFLRDEEAVRIAKLRKEEEEKIAKMSKKFEEMSKVNSSVSAIISDITELLSTDNVSFLQKYKSIIGRVTCTVPDPQLDLGALINVAEHLGSLKYQVWERMLGSVQYVPVTLDPNTANPWVILSDDLTSMKFVNKSIVIPDNPERFNAYEGVLGYEGFSSRKHCWDVDVGDSKDWVLGIAKQSVQRKVPCVATPENGFWALASINGTYSAQTSELKPTVLTIKKCTKIRLQLDWDKGLMSFHDVNSGAHLYTFKQKFNEKVFPYFYTRGNHRLIVEPVKINITKVK